MLFLPKKKLDGEIALRTVLDKREQNDNTIKLASPLPFQDETLLKVSAYPYKSVLDGKDAYEQIRVEEKDVPKTLFHTPLGTMVSQVMQQGDCNAGATYQQLMDHLFSAHIGVFMYVYLDDIIIFSNTIEEHVSHIRTILNILEREKFYLSPKKMQFFTKEINLLGHVIDEKGIKMDPHKVDSIEKWKTPTTKEQVASYIGALGYLAPNCKGIRRPMAILSKCASGTGRFCWEGTQERAFNETKQIVVKHRDTHRVALDYTTNAAPVHLITDASLTGASGVLTQGKEWKESSVIAFWSGKFDSAQQNYPVHDREALAIMLSLKKFEPMLQGIHFEILTDHRALEHLTTQKNLNQRQMRWLDFMSRFDFKIVYIEGTENILADALSRMYSSEEPGVERARSEYAVKKWSDDDKSRHETDPIGRSFTRPMLVGVAAAVAGESGTNSAMVRRNPTRNRVAPKRYDPAIPGREASEPRAKRSPRENLRIQEVGRKQEGETARVNIPSDKNDEREKDPAANAEPEGEMGPQNSFETQTPEIVKLVSEIDALNAIREGYADGKQFGPIIKNPEYFPNYSIIKGLLYMKDNNETVLCIPDSTIGEYNVRSLLIAHAHSILTHQGYKKTYAYMRESVWWKNMAKQVESFCRACTSCAASKQSTQHPYGLLKPLQVPKFPWSQIGIDFVGPLPTSKTLYGEFDTICVVVDHLTSMTHLIATRQDYTACDIAEALHANVFKLHGPPDIIISDRDKLFTSDFHKTICELLGTELGMSTSSHPETDGLVERKNGTLGGIVRTCVNRAQRDWAIQLPTFEFAINLLRLETTGFSPFKLNYGRMPRPLLIRTNTEFSGVKEHAKTIRHYLMVAHDAIIAQRAVQTAQANKGRRPAPFKVGDKVFVSTKNMSIPEGKARKLVNKWMGPVNISEELVKGTTYRVNLPQELLRRGIRPSFHASLLKPYIPDEDRRFPRHDYGRFISLEGNKDEWTVERITNHRGRGRRATFEVQWHGGEVTWEPYRAISHLESLRQYFEALGVKQAHQLPVKDGVDTVETASDNSESESEIFDENLQVSSIQVLNSKLTQYGEEHPHLRNAHLFTEYIHLELCPTTIRLAISTAHSLLVRELVVVAAALGAAEDVVAPLQTHTAISLTCSGFSKTQRTQEHIPNSYAYAGRTTPIEVLAAKGAEEVRDSNRLTSTLR